MITDARKELALLVLKTRMEFRSEYFTPDMLALLARHGIIPRRLPENQMLIVVPGRGVIARLEARAATPDDPGSTLEQEYERFQERFAATFNPAEWTDVLAAAIAPAK